jgi:Protein of unknown function (DUF3035)
MTGHRGSSGRYGPSLLAVALGSSILLLTGCSDFRQAIGMDRVGPDEFAVESRAPLTIPPDYDLRPPQAGAARPQEVSAAEKARKAIDTAGPGEPGKQASAGLRVPPGGLNSGAGADPSQQGEQTLSNKLLGYNGPDSGAAVEKRETTTLEGVH